MTDQKEPTHYEAKHAFGVFFDGEQITVNEKEIVRAGHPILEGREEHFKPVERFGRFDVDVEQATAAPGEKRGAQAKTKTTKSK